MGTVSREWCPSAGTSGDRVCLTVTLFFVASSTASFLSFRKGHSGALSGVLSLVVVGFCLSAGLLPGHAVAQSKLAVSIQERDARVGKSVDVPVRVTDFSNVGAISLIVTYDPDVLEFVEDADTPSLIAGTPRENFSANVVEPGELRISWFDRTGASPININEGTLLTITFHRYAGGKSPVAFAEGSEISNIKAEPVEAGFQDGRVAERP